jgi:enoyl-[acyl-carrier-protein] reductase (NADH)
MWSSGALWVRADEPGGLPGASPASVRPGSGLAVLAVAGRHSHDAGQAIRRPSRRRPGSEAPASPTVDEAGSRSPETTSLHDPRPRLPGRNRAGQQTQSGFRAAQVTDYIRGKWGAVDGALHAIAYAPQATLAGDFLNASAADVNLAFQTSTYSYATLARMVKTLAAPQGAALVGLTFDAAVAWPVYNWMGVCKAELEAVNRYLARDLGSCNIRTNLIAAGPLHTRAAGGIPSFGRLTEAWDNQAPLPWDIHDAAPVADAACFLLSDFSRATTGEVLHVDGG